MTSSDRKLDKVLQAAIITGRVHPATRVSVCIDLHCKDVDGVERNVGTGTGFLYRQLGELFLITNWHVVTGRQPGNPERLLSGYPSSPSSFSLYMSPTSQPNNFLPSENYNLYFQGEPIWLETSLMDSQSKCVDLVAIPMRFDALEDPPVITPINQFAPNGKDTLYMGRDLVVVGYPFGISTSNPFPIWKRGHVASETGFVVDGLPRFYIDSPGRPGMSGSPVFMLSKGKLISERTADLLENFDKGSALETLGALDSEELANAKETSVLQFAGVYSGSVGDKSLQEMQLGIVWHAALVDAIFEQPKKGQNDYPPTVE